MIKFENQTFERFYDRNSAAVFADIEFHRCTFLGCGISITLDPKLRSTLRNIRLIDCEQRGCSLESAILHEVLIDGFKSSALFQTWAAVFQHVTMRGIIDRLMVSDLASPGVSTSEQRREFEAANEEFYSHIDWALDISEAQFGECDLRGVPAKLIKRDPETQVIVTRMNAMRGEWRNLDLTGTHWGTALQNLLKRNYADTVFVAPKRHKEFKKLLAGLQLLRAAGVAEPA